MLRTSSLSNHPLRWLMLICCLAFFGTTLFYVRFVPPDGDEPHYLVISQTLLTYHSFDVLLDYQHGDYRAFYPRPIDPHITHNSRHDPLPVHGVGGPILWLLPYLLLGRLGAALFIALVSVLIIYNIYTFLRNLDISARTAFAVGLAYALASPFFIYAHLTFIEPIAALVCIYVLRKVFQKEISIADVALSSTLLGLLPWVHIRFAFLEIPLFCFLLFKVYTRYRFSNFRYYIACLAPVVILFLLFEFYDYTIWGSLNPASNEFFDHTHVFEVAPFQGLLGMFFDQAYGLISNFPVFLLLIAGMILAARRKFLVLNTAILLVSLPYLIAFTSFSHWTGGWCPPVRYMLVLIPLWSFHVAYALEHSKTWLTRLIFGVTFCCGLAYNLLTLVAPSHGFNRENGQNITLTFIQFFHHPLTSFLPSVFLPAQTGLFSAWIGLFTGLALLIVWSHTFKKQI